MGRNKSLMIYPESYVVLDIETTGFSATHNEIIELSAIKVENNIVREEFTTLVKPIGYIAPRITELTGITREMTANAPHIGVALVKFMEFVSNNIVVGHNVNFDINFIDAKLKEWHKTSFNNDYIDTLTIARKLLPQLKSHKLGNLAEYFKFNSDGMHRGLKDCQVTNLCYQEFLHIHSQPKLFNF